MESDYRQRIDKAGPGEGDGIMKPTEIARGPKVLSVAYWILAAMQLAGVVIFVWFDVGGSIASFSGKELNLPLSLRYLPTGWFVPFHLLYAVLFATGATFIWKGKYYLYVMIVAGATCVLFPTGTVVGVCALICLSARDVRKAFR